MRTSPERVTIRVATADPSRTVDKAIDALRQDKSELPLDEVDRALTSAPHDFRLWHIKGLMHRHEERRELAIPALVRAMELAPAEPLVAHGYARTMLEAGLPSVEPFARALKLAPNDPELVRGLAAALAAEGRTGEAIAGLQDVLDRSPLWTDGHRLLAELRWQSSERNDFSRSFDQALQIHPNSLELRREQLRALFDAEQFDEVLRKVEDGKRLFGRHALFIAFEAAARSEMGEGAAVDPLFAELALFGDASSAVRHIRHLIRTGRTEQALPIVDKWLRTTHRASFWPLASVAWRLAGDPRAKWLEGDEWLVGVHDIGDQLPLEALGGMLRKLHEVHGQHISQSVRGGSQTDGNLFHRIEPEIVAMREAVRSASARHLGSLPEADPGHPLAHGRPARVRFSGAWSVRLKAGGSHTNHVHPDGWLSSALYVALPETRSGQGEDGWLTLGEPDARLGLDLEPYQTVEPRPGRLVLFPSWIWHGTRPFPAGERLAVAFDVAPQD